MTDRATPDAAEQIAAALDRLADAAETIAAAVECRYVDRKVIDALHRIDSTLSQIDTTIDCK
jgi:hypothetical protein